MQTGFRTYHIFSNKKHVNSYDQNGKKPSYTLHYPEKKKKIQEKTNNSNLFTVKLLPTPTVLARKNWTSRGQKRQGNTGARRTWHTAKKAGNNVTGTCDIKWRETTGQRHGHGKLFPENKTLSLLWPTFRS